MKNRLFAYPLALLALVFLAAGVAAPPRTPAPIMTYEGADWLERPTRAQEDKPEEVLRAMKLKDGDLVADVGCGTGFYARRIAKAVGAAGKVYAVEIQPEMLDILRDRCAREEITNVVPILGTEDDPKLPPGKMDWILLVDVYHEFQDPEGMLKKLRESLAPGGKIALVEYRAEGDTANHIKPEHRMSVEQVIAEWLPAGFKLVERLETLPSQHLFIFAQKRD
ncbi:MAG: class I SAM-dependent methyltransferase [FCB group bacterium]|jgi:ubiquinone/menaquinone biosynthesis C-methylase UbiE|nr:class I SAM-dependent methyltransferase [FCB group bacterium]